ncbi:hypothetical protein FAGAP_11740 [Fusarium agapanthi]|uniref:Uncharacterized protein n=1 Tax=Fusarium agapanthi TaxID=1803897 RepID=A0A9P5B547_9HYPO|nr:hypothetical protein FAGAP_11740 [Fusarium agapanthi]
MSWKRSSLAHTGFVYDEDIRDQSRYPFPPHVKSLEQAMLDFTCQDFDPTTEKDLSIQNEAKMLAKGGFKEDRWDEFYRAYFFNPLMEHASITGKRPRISSRCQYYYDSIVFNTDALWTTFNTRDERSQLFIAPKPDLVFLLPMYHPESDIPTVTRHAAREWHKESTASLVEPFLWSTLKGLHQHGLKSTPFSVLNKKIPLESDLTSYPWLVVEYKRAKGTARGYTTSSKRLEEVLYCQAANASGCAVKLNQNAARFALPLAHDAQVSPVPVITTVGPEVKVWITFFAKDFMAYQYDVNGKQEFHRQEEGYMMQCIWTGDMTEPYDILKFRLILENTYTWAIRVFKPLVAAYIDQWRLAYPADSPCLASMTRARQQDKLELTRSTVRSIQCALEPELNPKAGKDWHRGVSVRLRELCETFTQDVDRMIEEELESWRRSTRGASKSSRGSKKDAGSSTNGRTRIDNEDLEPNQSGSPGLASVTPQGGAQSMPPSETGSAAEIVSSYFKASMAIWSSWGTQETRRPE